MTAKIQKPPKPLAQKWIKKAEADQLGDGEHS